MSDSHTLNAQERRWSVVRRRDSTETGFVYAVKTTGIYCRPGCSSRSPKRENVAFFDNQQLARAAGYRPCKRCRPDEDEPQLEIAEAVKLACRIIDESEEPPTLEQLAEAVNYSPSHFHRIFKRELGVTPRGYAATRRANRVRSELSGGSSVTKAVFASGYAASSRFYEESVEMLGMKPSEYRGGARGIRIRIAVAPTSLGPIVVAATDRGVCAIEFGDDEQTLRQRILERLPNAEFVSEDDGFQKWVDEVVVHVDAPRNASALPLDIRGTAFQRRVWETLLRIPAGTTMTYTEVAEKIGRPQAARAVAGACAANRVAVAVPCHRVLRADGGAGGYRWGIQRKQELLQREADETG